MDWSYVAGFFDGEGSVSLYPKRAILSIPNTNEQVIRLVAIYAGGGGITITDRRPGKWKPVIIWHVTSYREILRVLRKMLPFLIVKRERAEYIIRELTRRNLTLKAKRRQQRRRGVRIRSMAQKGKSNREIARRLHVSRQYVAQTLNSSSVASATPESYLEWFERNW